MGIVRFEETLGRMMGWRMRGRGSEDSLRESIGHFHSLVGFVRFMSPPLSQMKALEHCMIVVALIQRKHLKRQSRDACQAAMPMGYISGTLKPGFPGSV